VHFFFGTVWRAPMVLAVLASFALGLVIGALGMVPRWWKHRVEARRAHRALGVPDADPANAGHHGI
jgi:uncharacterized integral membrane protein